MGIRTRMPLALVRTTTAIAAAEAVAANLAVEVREEHQDTPAGNRRIERMQCNAAVLGSKRRHDVESPESQRTREPREPGRWSCVPAFGPDCEERQKGVPSLEIVLRDTNQLLAEASCRQAKSMESATRASPAAPAKRSPCRRRGRGREKVALAEVSGCAEISQG